MGDRESLGEVIAREEVRPGLVMIKRRLIKEDGRYLLHYDFEREATAPAAGPAEDQARKEQP